MQLADPADGGVVDDDLRRPRRMQERPARPAGTPAGTPSASQSSSTGPWRRRSPRRATGRARPRAASSPISTAAIRCGSAIGAGRMPAKPSAERPARAGGALRQVDAARLEQRDALGAPGEVVASGRRAGRRSGRSASPTAPPRAGCGRRPDRCSPSPATPPRPGATKLQVIASSRPASAEQVLEPAEQDLMVAGGRRPRRRGRAGSPAGARRARGRGRPPRSGRPRG